MRKGEKYLFDLNLEWVATRVASMIVVTKKLYLFKGEKERERVRVTDSITNCI